MAGGGRGIERPWRSKSEVPEHIWNGHKWGYPNWTDTQYLAALNDQYYWYWVRADQKKAGMKRSKMELNGQGSRVLCVGDHCRAKILREDYLEGKKLCTLCEALIRQKGQVGYIRYVEEPCGAS